MKWKRRKNMKENPVFSCLIRKRTSRAFYIRFGIISGLHTCYELNFKRQANGAKFIANTFHIQL